MGCTHAALAARAWRRTKPTAAWLSVTGSVFGIAHTAVKPPAAAARDPGRDHLARAFDDEGAVGRGDRAAHARDRAVAQEQVADTVEPRRGIQEAPTAEQDVPALAHAGPFAASASAGVWPARR